MRSHPIYIYIFMLVGNFGFSQQISLNLGVNSYSNRYIAQSEGFVTVYSDQSINKPRFNLVAGIKFEVIKQLSIEYTYQKSSKTLRYSGHWNGADRFYTNSEIFDNVLYWNLSKRFSILGGVRYVQFYNSHYISSDDTYNFDAFDGHFICGIAGFDFSIWNFSIGAKYSKSMPVNQAYHPIWGMSQVDLYVKYDLKFVLEENKITCPNF